MGLKMKIWGFLSIHSFNLDFPSHTKSLRYLETPHIVRNGSKLSWIESVLLYTVVRGRCPSKSQNVSMQYIEQMCVNTRTPQDLKASLADRLLQEVDINSMSRILGIL